jgi:predicted regulator of Ras-like GTPase activity (Roadblock/LC7/MglB family)
MAQLQELLTQLVEVEGIHTAVVVGRDGFLVDGVSRRGDVDTDAVGVAISDGIDASRVMGRELDIGEITQGVFEFSQGLIVTALVGRDAILAVAAERDANPGSVRSQLMKRARLVAEAL